tara:strand:- start:6329 stop:7408 length:1080 start_codon:yes stop_codon:yes gene_type:complete
MEKMVIDNFNSVYKNSRTFITGHTGFKGSWLSLWLTNLGANVSGLSLAPNEISHWNDLKLSSVKSYIGDLRNYECTEKTLLESDPEIIFHLAAQPLVRESYKLPIETWETNVIGTANLLEASRKLEHLKAIVIITSDKCYENKEVDRGYKEDDTLGGHDPYSSSKAATEVLVSSFRRSFFSEPDSARLVTARAGNVVGGGDWSENRLIPDIIRNSKSKDPLLIRYPKSTRPWQHVLDCSYGYLQLAKNLILDKNINNNAFNFGPEKSSNARVEDILKMIKSFWSEVDWKIDNEQNPHEAGFLYLNSTLSKNTLNWHPILNLKDTLKMTIDWYKNHDKNVICSKEQLFQYAEMLDNFNNN